METVATYSVAAIPLIWERVEVRVVGKRLVKRRVEDCDLRQPNAEDFARGLYAANVGGVVQRREFDAVLYAAQNLVRYRDRMREALAAVHDAVADGVNVGDALDCFYP